MPVPWPVAASSNSCRTWKGLIYRVGPVGGLLEIGVSNRRGCSVIRRRPFTVISGQISKDGNGVLLAGHLGEQLTAEDGAKAARDCALNILAQAQAALGTLDNVARIVRLNGFVAAAPGFTEHPQVINGASDLMVEVFQDRGRHTRAAIGVASLPAGVAVEIDAVIEIASSNAR